MLVKPCIAFTKIDQIVTRVRLSHHIPIVQYSHHIPTIEYSHYTTCWMFVPSNPVLDDNAIKHASYSIMLHHIPKYSTSLVFHEIPYVQWLNAQWYSNYIPTSIHFETTSNTIRLVLKWIAFIVGIKNGL